MSEFINTIDLLGNEAVLNSIIDGSITEFKDNILTFATSNTFAECKSLKCVDIPELKKCGGYLFYQCEALESVNIPKATDISNYTFDGCISLKEVALPSVIELKNSIFNNCSALETVDLSSATNIGNSSVFTKSALKTLILRPTTLCALSGVSTFSNSPFAPGKAGGIILVPSALVEEYKTATNWSSLLSSNAKNRVLALEYHTVDGTITGEIDWDKLNG